MKAIILAAGKGERLRGLVDEIPKPMIRIQGKPILEHNILWLKQAGINDISINLHHLPDVIRQYFGHGTGWGVTLRYSYEPELKGTAGAVRKIVTELWGEDFRREENFFVIYGDNFCRFDLTPLIAFHHRKKALATIGLYEKQDVSQSGIVTLDDNSRVRRFIEKPNPRQIYSHLVNAGVYLLRTGILKYVPADRGCDFGKDVFPAMARKHLDLFGIVLNGSLIAVDTPELLHGARNSAGQQC